MVSEHFKFRYMNTACSKKFYLKKIILDFSPKIFCFEARLAFDEPSQNMTFQNFCNHKVVSFNLFHQDFHSIVFQKMN